MYFRLFDKTLTFLISFLRYFTGCICILQNNVPVFTLPMTLVTLVLINVSDARGNLYRVEDPSYPEKQSYQWHTRTKVPTKVRPKSCISVGWCQFIAGGTRKSECRSGDRKQWRLKIFFYSVVMGLRLVVRKDIFSKCERWAFSIHLRTTQKKTDDVSFFQSGLANISVDLINSVDFLLQTLPNLYCSVYFKHLWDLHARDKYH